MYDIPTCANNLVKNLANQNTYILVARSWQPGMKDSQKAYPPPRVTLSCMIASSDGTDEPFPMGQNSVIHAHASSPHMSYKPQALSPVGDDVIISCQAPLPTYSHQSFLLSLHYY